MSVAKLARPPNGIGRAAGPARQGWLHRDWQVRPASAARPERRLLRHDLSQSAGREAKLAVYAPSSAEGRTGWNEYSSQASAPGSEPTARVRPKHIENSSACSGAIP